MQKPEVLPEWARQDITETRTVNGVVREIVNKKEPFEEWKNTGQLHRENLPREYLNWQLWNIGQWIEYFNSVSGVSPDIISESGEVEVNSNVLVDTSGGDITLTIPEVNVGDTIIITRIGSNNLVVEGNTNNITLYEQDGSTVVGGGEISINQGSTLHLIAIAQNEMKQQAGNFGSAAFREVEDFIRIDASDQTIGGYDAEEEVNILSFSPDDFATTPFATKLIFKKFSNPQLWEMRVEDDNGFTNNTALSFDIDVLLHQGTPLWSEENSATAEQMWAGAGLGIASSTIYLANAPVTSTGSGNIEINMAQGRKFSITLTGNSTLVNPINQEAGQEGIIFIEQDGTGGRSLAFGSNWRGVGGLPTIDDSPGAINVFGYYVKATGTIVLSYQGVLV